MWRLISLFNLHYISKSSAYTSFEITFHHVSESKKKPCSFPVLNSAGDLSSDYVPSGSHNDGLWQHIPLRADYVQVFTNIDGIYQDFYQEVIGFCG